MTKPQNSVHTQVVKYINHAYRAKGGNWLHMIEFNDNYQAEELTSEKQSNFLIGMECTYRVTHPGKNGGLDWIQLEGVREASGGRTSNAVPHQAQTAASQQPRRQISDEDLRTAQIAFQCATQYGLKENWDEETLVKKAYIFAGNIKRIAKEIGNATDI